MKGLYAAILGVVVVAGTVAAGHTNMTARVAGARLGEYMDRVAEFGFHGSVLVAKDGQVILHGAWGLADEQQGIANHNATAFSTGSVTKQYTATAILHLESMGKLTTRDTIGMYFDDVPVDKRTITIHHLLTHSAGLPEMLGRDDESLPRDDFIRLVMNVPLDLPVGQGYQYSNVGYALLAAIIEIVTDEDYEAYLKKTFWEPLGMHSTGMHMLAIDDSLIAHSHSPDVDYMRANDRPRDAWHLKGNGGILSTTADMYRWVTAVQGGEVLSPEAQTKMFVPYVKEGDMESHYGYGWVIQESQLRNSRIIWHNGGGMPVGWSCAVYNYLQDDLILIVFANKPMEGSHPVDQIVSNLVRLYFDPEHPLPPKRASVDESRVAALVGRYDLPGGNRIDVRLEAGTLRLAPHGQDAVMALFPTEMASYLPKYNVLTDSMVRSIAAGDFDGAESMFDLMSPDDDVAGQLKSWWQTLDSLGTFVGVDMIGTRMHGGSAKTYCRLLFAQGDVSMRFGWMQGRCYGLMPSEAPSRELVPQSDSQFICYSLREGDVITASFETTTRLVLASGESERVFTRRD